MSKKPTTPFVLNLSRGLLDRRNELRAMVPPETYTKNVEVAKGLLRGVATAYNETTLGACLIVTSKCAPTEAGVADENWIIAATVEMIEAGEDGSPTKGTP